MRELLAKFYECPTCEDYSMELTLREVTHGKTARCIVFNYEGHHFVALYREECKLIACDGEIIMNIPMRKAAWNMKGVNNIMTGCHRYETKIINGRQRCVGLKETSPGFYVLYITENKRLTCKLVWKYDTFKHPVGYSYKTGKPLNMTKHFGLEYSFKSMIQKYRHENLFSKSAWETARERMSPKGWLGQIIQKV